MFLSVSSRGARSAIRSIAALMLVVFVVLSAIPVNATAGASSFPPVYGLVTDAKTGNPIPEVFVTVERLLDSTEPWQWVGFGTTDSSGAYDVRIREGQGTYRVIFKSPNFLDFVQEFTFDGVNSYEANVQMERKPRLAFGTVTSARTGEPIAWASVFAERSDGDPNVWRIVSDLHAGADGTFELVTDQGPGVYRIGTFATDFDFVRSEPFTFDGTNAQEINVKLEPIVLLAFGNVTNAKTGVRPNYSWVDAFRLDEATKQWVHVGHTRSDYTGYYSLLAPAPPGTYQLRAGGVNMTDAVKEFTFDGTKAHVVHFPLNPLALSISVEGQTRFDTAVAASKEAFPTGLYPGSDRTVIIATGRNWPDALAANALAGVLDGPVLLVDTNSIPAVVSAEIKRLNADKAIIVGGTGAVGAEVESALKASLGSADVTRIAGKDRYETARLIATESRRLWGSNPAPYAFVATGGNFPDALSAASLSASAGWPIYLAHPLAGLSSDTLAAMQGITDVMILGGTGAVSKDTETALVSRFGAPHVTRLSGVDRYATAVAIANHAVKAGRFWNHVGISTGEDFPDALAGGMVQSKKGSVMLLTTPGVLHPATAAALKANTAQIDTVTFLGGYAAVSPAVRASVLDIVGD